LTQFNRPGIAPLRRAMHQFAKKAKYSAFQWVIKLKSKTADVGIR
jgi:hypothetical protein